MCFLKRVVDLDSTDASHGKTLEDFVVWTNKMIPQILNLIPVLTGSEHFEFVKQIENQKYKIQINKSKGQSKDYPESFRTNAYKIAFKGKLTSIKELRKTPDETEKTFLVNIRLEQNSSPFNLVDNIGIFPQNSENNVEKTIDHFQLNGNHYVSFKTEKNQEKIVFPFPDNLRIEKILRNHIDLHSMATFLKKKNGLTCFDKISQCARQNAHHKIGL